MTQKERSLPGGSSGWTETVLVVALHSQITPACFGSIWVTFPLFPVDQPRLAFCFSPWLLVSPSAFRLQHYQNLPFPPWWGLWGLCLAIFYLL